MRLHVRGGKGRPKSLRHLKDTLSELPGVTRAEANPDTGSIVLHYRHESPKHFAQEVQRRGAETQSFHLDIGEAGEMWEKLQKEANFLAAHSELARSVVEGTKRLDMEVKIATDNQLDLKVLVPLGLAVASFFFVGADVATPLWISLGVFSFNSFVSLHPPYPFPKTENEMEPRDEA